MMDKPSSFQPVSMTGARWPDRIWHTGRLDDGHLQEELGNGSEAKSPVLIRPTRLQRECVEQLAEQLGIKRSQLDATCYLTGALLIGMERLNQSERIGTWSRKEVAAYLKRAFTPLFELLYEQDELPLAFTLLLNRDTTLPHATRSATTYQSSPFFASEDQPKGDPSNVSVQSVEELPWLHEDAEITLEGFPEGI